MAALFALVTVHVVHEFEECTEQTKLMYTNKCSLSMVWIFRDFQGQNIHYYINLLREIMDI